MALYLLIREGSLPKMGTLRSSVIAAIVPVSTWWQARNPVCLWALWQSQPPSPYLPRLLPALQVDR
nr:MAG TPA: hypothetical protein [Caudoviricetes sp.]